MKEELSVLVVEDNLAINHFIKEDLIEQGFRVASAYTGKEAMEKLGAETFHIVIIDIRLKDDMSGVEVLKKIKSNRSSRGIWVIMHTVFGAPEDIERSKRLGADAYVAKLAGDDENEDLLIKEVISARNKLQSFKEKQN